jgi:LAO/AO transport system kinase
VTALTRATELAERIRAAVPAAVARGITWCENGGTEAERLLACLPGRIAPVVGLTGAPGAGKSTLVAGLVQACRAADRTVAVVAVDPSSPVTGGALLGDRIRLDGAVGDRGLFFRSLASRGAAGGLADAAWGATRVLSAAGFQLVIVEAVGAGQAEVAIMRVADTVTLVLQPGAGDEVQALKAGLMEIADVYVLNKADRPGLAELRSHVKATVAEQDGGGWTPALIETVAHQGSGVEALLAALDDHRAHLAAGAGGRRTKAGARAEALRIARAAFDAALGAEAEVVLARLDAGDLREAEAGRILTGRAARALSLNVGR